MFKKIFALKISTIYNSKYGSCLNIYKTTQLEYLNNYIEKLNTQNS